MKNRIQKETRVYVIQENIGGVSEEPVVFLDARRANRHYIKLVNEVFNTEFKNLKETVEYLRENNGEDNREVLYWTLNVQ